MKTGLGIGMTVNGREEVSLKDYLTRMDRINSDYQKSSLYLYKQEV